MKSRQCPKRGKNEVKTRQMFPAPSSAIRSRKKPERE